MVERGVKTSGHELTQNSLQTLRNAFTSADSKESKLFAVTRTSPQNATASIRLSTVSLRLRGNPSHRSNDSYNGASSSRIRKHPSTICVTCRLVM